MPKIKSEHGVKTRTYGKVNPIIYIGEGDYAFKIKSGGETKIYLFETEALLDKFRTYMQKLYPKSKIK